jgi:hypothetical protein
MLLGIGAYMNSTTNMGRMASINSNKSECKATVLPFSAFSTDSDEDEEDLDPKMLMN